MYKKKVYSYIPTETTWGFPGGTVAKIPWRRKRQPLKYSYLDEEPGRLQAMGLQSHDSVTKLKHGNYAERKFKKNTFRVLPPKYGICKNA